MQVGNKSLHFIKRHNFISRAGKVARLEFYVHSSIIALKAKLQAKRVVTKAASGFYNVKSQFSPSICRVSRKIIARLASHSDDIKSHIFHVKKKKKNTSPLQTLDLPRRRSFSPTQSARNRKLRELSKKPRWCCVCGRA